MKILFLNEKKKIAYLIRLTFDRRNSKSKTKKSENPAIKNYVYLEKINSPINVA
jgi:hypothetical protein